VLIAITAPLPAGEEGEEPMPFIATTLAYTLSPTIRLKGDAISVVIGIVHCVLAAMIGLAPLQ